MAFSIQTGLRGCTVLASVQGSEAGTSQLEIKSSLIFYETGTEQTTGIFGVYPQPYKSLHTLINFQVTDGHRFVSLLSLTMLKIYVLLLYLLTI